MDKGEKQKNQKSKILVFGGTGYLGKYMVKASASLGHETYVYTRPVTSQTTPSKLGVLDHFKSMDVTIVQGELDDHEKIVSLLEQVDVVISTLAYPQCLDQLKVIEAMKAAGTIKRFFPSEYGLEADRVSPLPPFEEVLEKKRMVRRATEAAGIPYTYVSANCHGAYFVNYLLRPHEQNHDVSVYGSGEALAVLNYELDIAVYTIKLADDPRACNRIVIYRPEKNIISQLQLISLWEKKTGLSFNRVHIPEEDLVNLSKTLQPPNNIPISILHSVFVKGDTMSYRLDKDDLEISVLCPDYDYTSIDGLLDIFLVDPPEPASTAFE